jgi:hypothetical protein
MLLLKENAKAYPNRWRRKQIGTIIVVYIKTQAVLRIRILDKVIFFTPGSRVLGSRFPTHVSES